MKPIEKALTPSDGKINTLKRNTVEGWWEIEVGLPSSWVFDENSNIGCEIIFENKIGKLVKVFPKNHNIVIDDLVTYVDVIIETNEKIAEKEKQFTDKMQEMKDMLEKEAQKFYTELDELKENSFKKNSVEFDEKLNSINSDVKKIDDKLEKNTEPENKIKKRAPRNKKILKDKETEEK